MVNHNTRREMLSNYGLGLGLRSALGLGLGLRSALGSGLGLGLELGVYLHFAVLVSVSQSTFM